METLSTRALSRATLARQLLLERHDRPVLEAVEQLVGLQAQVPTDPYTALWSRLEAFDPESLSTLLEQRRLVRTTVMRGTLHLVSESDAVTIRPVIQGVLDGITQTQFRRFLDGVDRDQVMAVTRQLVEEKPRTPAELGRLLSERWPDNDGLALRWAAQYWLPMVQVTPRGMWRKSSRAASTTYESWLGRPAGTDASPDGLMLRYLAAFGPASPADAATWSRLPAMAEVFERLRPQLVCFTDEQGRELFDLPDAPRPDPDTPAPVRLLPEYDNLVLSHADRSRVVPETLAQWPADPEFPPRGSVLVDGFLAGFWRLDRAGGRSTMRLHAVLPLSADEEAAVDDEARRLLGFLTDGSADAEISYLGAPRRA